MTSSSSAVAYAPAFPENRKRKGCDGSPSQESNKKRKTGKDTSSASSLSGRSITNAPSNACLLPTPVPISSARAAPMNASSSSSLPPELSALSSSVSAAVPASFSCSVSAPSANSIAGQSRLSVADRTAFLFESESGIWPSIVFKSAWHACSKAGLSTDQTIDFLFEIRSLKKPSLEEIKAKVRNHYFSFFFLSLSRKDMLLIDQPLSSLEAAMKKAKASIEKVFASLEAAPPQLYGDDQQQRPAIIQMLRLDLGDWAKTFLQPYRNRGLTLTGRFST